MTAHRKPQLEPGADPVLLTIKPKKYSMDEPYDVLLVPSKVFTEAYKGRIVEVYLPDTDGNPGEWVGTVEKYTGSLDTKVGRLRREGTRRTLWATKGVYKDARNFFGQTSRAEAIRDLVRSHERRASGIGW